MKHSVLFKTAGLMVTVLSMLGAAKVFSQELVFNTQEFTPFSYLSGSDVAGPAADVIKLVCKTMGQEHKLALLPWTRAQQEVKDGKAHALFLIGWNAEREGWLWQSLPIVDTEYGFFVRNDNPLKYTGPEQLKDYSVAVYGPSNTSTTLDKIKLQQASMAIENSPDDDTVFRKLDGGRVMAAFSNRDVGMAIIKRLGLKNVRYAGVSSKLKYYIGFSKEYVTKETVEKFNAAYRKLSKSGDIPKILKSYSLEASAIE